jgi:5'-nucleotidase (lipoprotein e(P4) family)
MKSYIPSILILFLSCTTQRTTTIGKSVLPISTQGKIFATLFQQRAAEYYALCYQSFNIAKMQVDQWKAQSKPAAIVTDIDETILDNSMYAAHQSLQGKDYDAKSWAEWTAMSKADTVPGGLSFLKYAASKGIEIFYITNREETERTGTLGNLQHFNFPNADNAHLILRQGASSKEARRINVLKTHDILLLMGDNLTDFSALYDKKSSEDRITTTQRLAASFGNKFIILPNPVYGDWETSFYNYNYNLSDAQKDSALRSRLKSY